jgi:hypothetical protein
MSSRDQDNVVAKAIAALEESVASIVGCDDDDATKRNALAETFTQFQTYLDRNGGGDIVEKARGGGAHDLAGRLIQHLTDALDHKRERHGFEKRKEPNMDTLTSIMKSGGIGATCAAVIAKGSTSFSEFQIVEAASAVAHDRHPELSASQAFAKVYTAATDEGRVLREAINVAKLQPAVLSGGEMRDAGDAAQAMDQLREIGRRMAPTATAEKQFAVAFEDPKNVALALRVHQRPSATTSFPFPR